MNKTKHMIFLLIALLVLALGGAGSRVIGQGGPLFVDISDAALGPARLTHAGPGVDFFPSQPNPFPQPGPPVGLGGGAVIADLNGDGWNDIFITNGQGGANALYLNNADGVPTFTEVAAAAGVAVPGDEAAAAVAGDVDNDGDVDLYVSNVGLPPLPGGAACPATPGLNRLFLNMGNDDSGVPQFVDVAADAGAAGNPGVRSQSPSLVDFDGDGDLDIFVAAHTHIVVPFFTIDSPMYPFKGPPTLLSMLLRNNLKETGELTFTDVTGLLRNETSGTLGADGRPIFDSTAAYEGVWSDIDSDGDQDLVMADELGALGTFRNNGNSTFTYVTNEVGLGGIFSSRGLAFGDINGDGTIDLFVTSIGAFAGVVSGVFTGAVHRLYLNDGAGSFTDVAGQVGLANPAVDGDTSGDAGWGAALVDIDNDGDLDVVMVGNWFPAGFGVREPFSDMIPPDFIAQGEGGHTSHGHLFENQGVGKQGNPVLVDRLATADERASAGIDNPFDARALAVGDLDNDGFQDIVIVNVSGFGTLGTSRGFVPIELYTGQVVIYKNQGNANRALILRLQGTQSNHDGIGARVTVVTDQGSQVREVRAGEGHYAQNSLEIEFGLGTAEQVQRIEINWPSGTRQAIAGFPLTAQVSRINIEEP